MTVPPEQFPRRSRPPQALGSARPAAARPSDGRPVGADHALPGELAGSSRRPRIAVLRALALGDLLCAVPALRALRASNPEAEISLIGLPWAREFVERFDAYLDRFVEFPGFPGIPERAVDPAALIAFLARAQAEPLDLVIQLQGDGTHSNAFVQLLGARRTAGHYLPAMGCPDPASFAAYPGHGSEVRRHLALMEFLGFPARGDELEFPLSAADEAEAARLRSSHGLVPGEFACVHAGASIPARRWQPERFARIADCLTDRGLRVVLTGTAPERPIAGAVAAAMRLPAENLAGATSLGGVAALLQGARLLVSNDTSLAHLAAALRVPSVVVFLASERERWAAGDRRLHVAVGEGAPGGCGGSAGCNGVHRCLREACVDPGRSARSAAAPPDVPVEAVWAAVEGLLGSRPEALDVA